MESPSDDMAASSNDLPEEPLPFPTMEEIRMNAPKKMVPGTDYSTFRHRVEFVLFTVNDNEFIAGTIYVNSPDIEKDHTPNCSVFKPGICMGMFAGHPVGLIKTDMGRVSGEELADVVIHFPNVKYVVSIGVCYAFDHDKKLADVLISDRISAFDTPKVNEAFTQCRGCTLTLEGKMKRVFCDTPSTVEEFPVSKHRSAKFYTGPIASCSILINDLNFRDKLGKSLKLKPIGGEMEGGELIRFNRKNGKDVIIIKGVCDYADGQKEKSWQLIAAAAAFHYAKQKMSLLTASSDGASGVGTIKTGNSAGADSRLSLDDLREVFNDVVTLEADWTDLALQLGLRRNTINSIEANKKNVRQCLTCALEEWLRLNYDHKKYGRPSWRCLTVAVSNIDTDLSEEIMRKHGIP